MVLSPRCRCARNPSALGAIWNAADLNVRFSNRTLMSRFHCSGHITGRVLVWVTLLFAVGTGRLQPPQALVGRCEFSGLETSAIGRSLLFTQIKFASFQ